MPEQQNIEYKQSWHDDYLKWDHNSRPRNPIIANACFFAGYIDTWGRGTLKIINSCKEAGLPEPEIKEMNGGVEVTIFISEVTENGLADGLVDGLVENETGGVIGGAKGGVNEEEIGGQVGGQVGLADIARELGSISDLMALTPEINTERLMPHFGLITEYIKNTFGKEFGKEFGKRNSNLEYCFRNHCTLP
ncbi:MAG TPA: hypothetical protein DHV48_11005 [Prolixibacteraceae bacterium]|nr:hypothetical protein [Prolixibacteraceae bacterium]